MAEFDARIAAMNEEELIALHSKKLTTAEKNIEHICSIWANRAEHYASLGKDLLAAECRRMAARGARIREDMRVFHISADILLAVESGKPMPRDGSR